MALMDAETWLTAQDCLDQGFATAITQEADQIEEGALALARQFKLLGRMKRVPAALKRTPAQMMTWTTVNNASATARIVRTALATNAPTSIATDSGCLDCPMQVDAGASSNRAPSRSMRARRWRIWRRARTRCRSRPRASMSNPSRRFSPRRRMVAPWTRIMRHSSAWVAARTRGAGDLRPRQLAACIQRWRARCLRL